MVEKQPSETDTDKLKRRNRELYILSTIAEALNREVDLDRSLQTALEQVADLFGLHTGWVFLRRNETSDSYLASAQNLPPALAGDPASMEGSCSCLDSYRAGGLDNRDRVNVITCSRLQGLLAGTDGLRYHASIPLYGQNKKKLGVLNVASAEAHWWELSSEDLRLLHIVGDVLSIAIERTRLFARSTQMGAVEERNRLAREIHDTLAQGLTAITLKLETTDALLEAGVDPARVRQTVQQTLNLTRANLDEVRRSVLDLRAAPLEGRDLAEALTVLIHDLAAKNSLEIEFEATGHRRPLPLRVEAGLYRVAQEALTNVIQHAQAEQVLVQLIIKPTQAHLLVEDDGQGFNPEQVPPGHYGLIGLNERVKLLGGQLVLKSCPGAGTRIEVTVPLD